MTIDFRSFKADCRNPKQRLLMEAALKWMDHGRSTSWSIRISQVSTAAISTGLKGVYKVNSKEVHTVWLSYEHSS